MPAPASIVCVKCATVSAVPTDACAKCGGRNARVCGDCGFSNSVAKGYCDKCGGPISQLGPAPSAPARAEAPGIPATAVRRISPPAGAPAPGGLPPARSLPSSAAAHSGAEGPVWPTLAPTPSSMPKPRPAGAASWRGRLRAAAPALLGLAVAAALWSYRESRRPEVMVPRLAAEYLDALSAGDFPRAYELLTEASRAHCTLEEFRESRDLNPWSWSKLRVERIEPDALLLAYELNVAGAPPRTDRVLFVRDGRRWARPYAWNLMKKVEEAFDRGSPDLGLVLAQTAAEIDPRDPMARGYLCEAAYYRRLPQETERQCVSALQLAARWPSKLTLKSLYHLRAILGDTYKNSLARPDKALEQYAAMLAFPDISPADQCEILLARAETYIAGGRPGEALADLDRAGSACASPKDLAYLARARRSLQVPP